MINTTSYIATSQSQSMCFRIMVKHHIVSRHRTKYYRLNFQFETLKNVNQILKENLDEFSIKLGQIDTFGTNHFQCFAPGPSYTFVT